MSSFEIGDKVKYVGSTSRLKGMSGVVAGFAYHPVVAVKVLFNKDTWQVFPEELKLISKADGTISIDEANQKTDWTDKHYDFFYKLTPQDIVRGEVKIDPYRVSKQWGLGAKDESGVLFHIVKTCARFGGKNSREREIKALYAQIKCLADIEGVEL